MQTWERSLCHYTARRVWSSFWLLPSLKTKLGKVVALVPSEESVGPSGKVGTKRLFTSHSSEIFDRWVATESL